VQNQNQLNMNTHLGHHIIFGLSQQMIDIFLQQTINLSTPHPFLSINVKGIYRKFFLACLIATIQTWPSLHRFGRVVA
jgi:hypothetical protein